MPKYVIDLMSTAKYGDMLHPHASKQYLHLPNYIISHTNRCASSSIFWEDGAGRGVLWSLLLLQADSWAFFVMKNISCSFYKCIRIDNAACYVTCLKLNFHTWVGQIFFFGTTLIWKHFQWIYGAFRKYNWHSGGFSILTCKFRTCRVISCHIHYISIACFWSIPYYSLYIGRPLEIMVTLHAHVFVVILTQTKVGHGACINQNMWINAEPN